MRVGSKYEDDLKKMANILSQQYKLVFTTPKDVPNVSLKPPQNGNFFQKSITEKDINKAINDIAITSAPGPDRIMDSVYKEYAD